MKIFDIALKDLKQSFRSWFALAFMFGLPILMTVMFVFLFGGLGGGADGEVDLPITAVQVVNRRSARGNNRVKRIISNS